MLATLTTLLAAILLNAPIRDGTIFYGLDGAYIHSFIRESKTWVPTGTALTFDQVRGPWNLMFPINTNLIPIYFLPSSVPGNSFAVLTACGCAMLLFVCALGLGSALGYSMWVTCGAGWFLGYLALPTTWMPLLYPVLGIAPHFVDLFALPAALIALFLGVGRSGLRNDFARTLAIAAIALYLVVSDPLLVVISGVALVVYGAAGFAAAESRAEMRTKFVLITLLAVSFLASGTHSFLLGIAEFSVPRFFANELAWMQGSTQFASIFFHESPFSTVGRWAIVLSAIEAVWLTVSGTGRARRMAVGHLVATLIIVVGGWLAVTQLQRWPGPSVLYFEYSIWPFYAVYSFAFICRVLTWILSALTMAAPSLAKHWTLRTPYNIALFQIPILCCAFGLQSRAAPVTSHFLPYPPAENRIEKLLVNEIGAIPDEPFRGRLATFTGIAGAASTSWNEVHGYDAKIYSILGSDFRFLGPWSREIPTLQEYSQVISPLSYLIQSRFLARPGDRQIRNISLFSRIDSEILQAWGVRYVVSDIAVPDGRLLETIGVGKIRDPLSLFELPDPNTGTYSPRHVTVVEDLPEAMAFLSRRPDLHEEVALFEQISTRNLYPARATLRPHAGKMSVEAQSDGPAVLLMPLAYSSCLRLDDHARNSGARLLQANVAQLAVYLPGTLKFDLIAEYGILQNSYCRRTDSRLAINLGIREAAKRYPPGVGR